MHIKISHLFFIFYVLQSTSILNSSYLREFYLSLPVTKALKKDPNNSTLRKIEEDRRKMCATCTTASIGCCYAATVCSASWANTCFALSCVALLTVPSLRLLDTEASIKRAMNHEKTGAEK